MLDKIRKLGLNDYESKAYACLLRIGQASAVDVSKHGVIPRARVYDVLFSLEKKGFVIKSASRPVQFSALKPTVAFQSLANSKKEELFASLEELEKNANSLEGALGSPQAIAGESAWVIEGRGSIYSLLGQELEKCSRSVIISSSSQGIARKKGVFEAKLAKLEEAGVEVVARTSRNEGRYVVFDDHSALLFLTGSDLPQEQDKALFIKSPSVAAFLASKK
ncbi:MAG TPA: helix-turn-helix domain-containing protein [archaeon]|nr:helix-turn-helix domain-containing protein [archaeon]